MNLIPPNNIKQVRLFVGFVDYYMDMWDKQSHLLQLLTEVTSTKVTFKWTDVEQKMFDKIK